MGIYVICGGANGIGRATADILKNDGHHVIVIDLKNADINADLGTEFGRASASAEIARLYPDGIDGLAYVAGISQPNTGKVLSVNYFGAITMAENLYPLLEKKSGSCVIACSASLAWLAPKNANHIAELVLACGDEKRISDFVQSYSGESVLDMYYTSKLAISLWVRRHSIEWGIKGVRLTTVAPGCVNTQMGALSPEVKKMIEDRGLRLNESGHRTIPTHFNDLSIMEPEEVGEVFAFMLSHRSRGINGSMIFADAGQEVYYNREKVYFN